MTHHPIRTLVLMSLVMCISAADAAIADGEIRELPAGADDSPYSVSNAKGTLTAKQPVTCTGPMTLARTDRAGLTATFFATSLRRVTEDDWRLRTDSTGTRMDQIIVLQPDQAGTPAERARFKIGGSDTDWDNFSIQWDGILTIPTDGVDLATNSDDSSRVWIDRNSDGILTADEWGSNNWGRGQALSMRIVHQGLSAGRYTVRVQYEDGMAGNSMYMNWRNANGDRAWKPVPTEAFSGWTQLTVIGPVTLRNSISGQGNLECKDGVRLTQRPNVNRMYVSGLVTLAEDLDLRGLHVNFSPGGILNCAGYHLTIDQIEGSGTIALAGGTLSLPSGVTPIEITGPGVVQAAPGVTVVKSFDDTISLGGEECSLRDPRRCLINVKLSTPLATIVRVSDMVESDCRLTAKIMVPEGAPADLKVGVWRADRTGRWFQRGNNRVLIPGTQEMEFTSGSEVPMRPEEHTSTWNASTAAESGHLGFYFSASTFGSGRLSLRVQMVQMPRLPSATTQLTDLAVDGWNGTTATAITGKRWEMHVRPVPYPRDPFDPELFSLNLEVTEPDGTQRVFAGFHNQDMQRVDEGDRETFIPIQAPRFTVRFRPRISGVHRLRLLTSGSASRLRPINLGDLFVTGPKGDGMIRVDDGDPRFFSVAGRFIWPCGLNFHSPYDTRASLSFGTKLTADRGSFVRETMLDRLAAYGGTCTETWLSAWNLGLEWNPRWRGYHGSGRYHEGHAWAVDRFLDQAERLGISVNLTIFNHGMARDGTLEDAAMNAENEWPYHPYNIINGGWLDSPNELFTDTKAFSLQVRLFRYITARFADSPALLGWKLWAEVNLANASLKERTEWHRRASEALHRLDPYKHGITTHWCGDWRDVDPAIGHLPKINYVTIDAYHDERINLATLLCQSIRDPTTPWLGLAYLGKPVLVTEFGGGSRGCSQQQLEAEHAYGPWVGLVSGHAAAPMLWWWEWVDQHERFGVYRALSRFIAGEDLRGPRAACVAPVVICDGIQQGCRAWRNGTRWLGYLLDRAWSVSGDDSRQWHQGTVTLEAASPASSYAIEWWNPETGTIIERRTLSLPSGVPSFAVPEFRRHLAFKIQQLP